MIPRKIIDNLEYVNALAEEVNEGLILHEKKYHKIKENEEYWKILNKLKTLIDGYNLGDVKQLKLVSSEIGTTKNVTQNPGENKVSTYLIIIL